jgi:hypothetical protein
VRYRSRCSSWKTSSAGLAPIERQVHASALVKRAVAVSRGNPGLQDLIVLRLVHNDLVPLDRAETTVADMQTYLDQGDLPSDGEVRAFLEPGPGRAAGAGRAGERGVLRACTLFELPVPDPVVEVLAEQVGGPVTRL